MKSYSDKSQKFMELARERFKLAVAQEREIRTEAEIDLHFVAGENQWDEGIKRDREASDRPALTFSKLHTYIQQVANEARQNKPQPKVSPLGGGATTDVANVLNGIIRHVHYRSHADKAYDTALDYSAGGGFGFTRLLTEYADPKSFDQEICIESVVDPFAVYGVLMPACRGEECKYAFVVKRIPRDEYKAEYGDDDDAEDFQSDEWRLLGDEWLDEKTVRIAEYWYVEDEEKTLRLVQGPDGSTHPIYTDDPAYKDSLPFVVDPKTGEPMERDVTVPIVKTCTIDGLRCLPGTETEWVGSKIPIIPVLGRQMIVEGEVKLFSLVRHVRDPQQLINIYKTAIAEKIALGNRVPYIGYKGQFTDPKWQDANSINYPYLESEPVMINGTLAPLPQRQQMEEQIQALSMAVAQEIDDLKSGMGIFDQSLGEGVSEQSGKGILARQKQASITNFHFSDNLQRAQWELCRQLLEIIPKIYDRPGRQVRIVGEDQQHSVAVVNAPYVDPDSGVAKHHRLDVGEYDVVVSMGPSYDTARMEGADTLSQFFQAAPQTVPILGDLWVGSLDYPWAREGARRLKLAAPQNIVNEDKGQQQIPPQVQQQMQQMQTELQSAHQFAASLHEQLQAKMPELQSRERMHAADLDFKREQLSVTAAIGEAQAKNVSAIALLNSEIAAIKHERGLSTQMQMQAADQSHERAMQAGQQQQDAALQQGQQQHEAQQQAAAGDQQAAMQQSSQDHDASQAALAQQQQQEAA